MAKRPWYVERKKPDLNTYVVTFRETLPGGDHHDSTWTFAQDNFSDAKSSAKDEAQRRNATIHRGPSLVTKRTGGNMLGNWKVLR